MTAFDFGEFLTVAEELGNRGDQASRRSAVSRAYYAVLGVAYRALPQVERARITHGNVHRVTWALYTASSDRRMRRLGNLGLGLRTGRITGDYDAAQVFSATDVALVLADAREILDMLGRYSYRP